MLTAENPIQCVHFAKVNSNDSNVFNWLVCLRPELLGAILPKERAQMLVKPLQILFAVPWAPSPMAPDCWKHLQLANTRFHVRNLILGIFRTAYLFDPNQPESTALAIWIWHSREV